MKFALGFDEETEVTDSVVEHLKQLGHAVQVFEAESWPVIAAKVAREVSGGRADQGILFCWTGTGTSIAANKIRGIRAALAWEPWIAKGARLWNDANVLVMSSKRLSPMVAAEILDAWLSVEEPEEDEVENIGRVRDLEK